MGDIIQKKMIRNYVYLVTGVACIIILHLSSVVGMQNTIRVEGSSVTMKCPSADCTTTDWYHKDAKTLRVSIYRPTLGFTDSYKTRYSMDNSSDCGLVINNIIMTDAGLFVCEYIAAQKSVQMTAYLIVLKSGPKCEANVSQENTVERDSVHMTCEVTYNGTDNVSVAWKNVADASVAVEEKQTIKRSFSIVASRPEVPSYECVISFWIRMDSNVALNIPTAICKTPIIKVLYPVTKVQLTPSQAVYSPGSQITCSAEGIPAPKFKWQQLNNTTDGRNNIWKDIPTTIGPVFNLCYATTNFYRCVATNTIRNKIYNEFSAFFQVNYTSGFDGVTSESIESCSVSIGMGFGIGFMVAVLLILAAQLLLFRLGSLQFRHNRMKDFRDAGIQFLSQNPNEVGQSISSNDKAYESESDKVPAQSNAESQYASLESDRDLHQYSSLADTKKMKQKQPRKIYYNVEI